MLNVLSKSRQSQNIRDLYRYRCGYGPCVIFQKNAVLQESSDQGERHFPDFKEMMSALEVRRGENYTSEINTHGEKYMFIPGDIVVVNPGFESGVLSGEKWWLLQINKPHESKRNGSGCHVYGFWLEEQDSNVEGCRFFQLLPTSVKIYLSSCNSC